MPGDTIRVPLPPRADSILKNDSTRLASKPPKSDTTKAKADTIKPSLARAPVPPIIEIGPPHIYDRAALFATGKFGTYEGSRINQRMLELVLEFLHEVKNGLR